MLAFSDNFEGGTDLGLLGSSTMLRESVFYAAEAAYTCQYRDFAAQRYQRDRDWLITNVGFDISEAVELFSFVQDVMRVNVNSIFKSWGGKKNPAIDPIAPYRLPIDLIIDKGPLSKEKTQIILDKFTVPAEAKNEDFLELGDYNVANALPFIRLPDGEVVYFQEYVLFESLYDNPMYWIGADRSYKGEGLNNRGKFCEDKSVECLSRVFDAKHVFPNVLLKRGDKVVGEIDALVVFGDHLVICQAKSKRMTLGAKKGNVPLAEKDFQIGIVAARDQLDANIDHILSGDVRLADIDGNPIKIKRPTQIYPLILISDYYPALSAQVRHFLKTDSTVRQALRPFVCDLFTIDEITEFLSSPLRFLSFLQLRSRFDDKLIANGEHTLLGVHLAHNLAVPSDIDMANFGDDMAQDMEAAFLVRRDGLPGNDTPPGILTNLNGTLVYDLISQIEGAAESQPLEIGFMLLETSEDSLRHIDKHLRRLRNSVLKSGGLEDISIPVDWRSSGWTIHITDAELQTATKRIQGHMEFRKMHAGAERWHGLIVRPSDFRIRLGLTVQYPVTVMKPISDLLNSGRAPRTNIRPLAKSHTKIGRNEPCPCGSNKKYKKCHGAG